MLAYFIEETKTVEGSVICSNSMAVTNHIAGIKLRSARHRGPWAAGFVWLAQSGVLAQQERCWLCVWTVSTCKSMMLCIKKSSVESHKQILNYTHFISPDM